MNWEYYNKLVDLLSPIHSYFWILYNSSSSIVEQVSLLGLLSFFTPSQIIINIFLTGIIFFKMVRARNWIRFALYLSVIRFVSLVGGAMLLPLLDSFLYNFVTGLVQIAVGPFLIAVVFFVFFKRDVSGHGYWLWTIGILILFSLYKDPMMVSILNVFLGEVNVDSNLVKISLFYSILLIPILLPFLIYYAFEIDVKVFKKERIQKGLYVVVSVLMILVSINEIILYWL